MSVSFWYRPVEKKGYKFLPEDIRVLEQVFDERKEGKDFSMGEKRAAIFLPKIPKTQSGYSINFDPNKDGGSL